MLIKPIVANFINTAIIAPHGVTDLIHALQFNSLQPLYAINLITTTAFALLGHAGLSDVANIPFLLASVVHFRHDIPLENKFMQYVIISAIITAGIQNTDIFYLYMILRHVPRHYAGNWKYMEKFPLITILLLSVTTFATMKMESVIPMDETNIDLIKGVIVAHIIYEEKYIHD